jgi:hypothetical protein
VLAIVAMWRFRGRFRDDGGLRRYAGLALDGIGLLWTLVRKRHCGPRALAGMTLFWAGEIVAPWAGLAAFGVMLLAPVVILADAIGYVLTRRAERAEPRARRAAARWILVRSAGKEPGSGRARPGRRGPARRAG